MAEKVLNTIANCVNPRVHSSYIRLLCNGWMTGRRFQGQKRCSFQCGAQEDSIEHFVTCRVVISCYRKFLDLHPPELGLELDHLLCMDLNCDYRTHSGGDEDLFSRICRRRVLGCYALYMLHNKIRHGLVDPDDYQDAFGRFVRNGELGMDQRRSLSE